MGKVILQTFTLADIPPEEMSMANLIFSLIFQS